jgi:hypothetical protein
MSDFVNEALLENKSSCSRMKPAIVQENITLHKIMNTTDVLIRVINNKKSWTATQFIGMIF